MRALFTGLFLTTLCAAQVPPVIETPEARYIPVGRPGYDGTFLTGIAANGRISGVGTVSPAMSDMPPQYTDAQGFLLSGGVLRISATPAWRAP